MNHDFLTLGFAVLGIGFVVLAWVAWLLAVAVWGLKRDVRELRQPREATGGEGSGTGKPA